MLTTLSGQTHTADADEKTMYRKIGLRLLPLLGLCYLVAYLDRINVGFAKLSMLDDLGLGDRQFGLAAGLFFAGYVLFETPSNFLQARVGARVWIARIMISWGVLSVLCATVSTAWHLYALRFLLGVAEAGFLPGVLFYLSGWFPSHMRGRVFSLFLVGLPLAGVLGAPLSGAIMAHLSGVAGISGWQWLFIVEGLPSVVLGIVFLMTMPSVPAHAKWLDPAEKARLAADLAHDAPPHAPHGFLAGLIDWKIWVLGGVDFAILMVTYALSFWLPSLIKATGVTQTTQIGWLVAIPNLCALISMLVLSWSSDRLRERRRHIMIPFAIGALALVALPFAPPTLGWTIVLLSIVSATVTGVVPVYFSLPATFLRGEAAAAGFALATSLANIAGLVSNTVMGFAANALGGISHALWIFAGFLVMGIVLVKILPADEVNR